MEILNDIYRRYQGSTEPVSSPNGSPVDPDELPEQLSKFLNKARHINNELGAWASDYFITESVYTLETASFRGRRLFSARQDVKERLLRALRDDRFDNLRTSLPTVASPAVSEKAFRLIEVLGRQDGRSTSGIIFVEQRATVGALNALIRTHPLTRNVYRPDTFVGMSNANYVKKLVLSEIFDVKVQMETLAEFRAGEKNLVIATSVLEEGIDVSACNLVICFDLPKTLKSFIQCRGRARKGGSQYVLLFPQLEGKNMSKVAMWEDLERELIAMYQDENRRIKETEEQECIDEDVNYKMRIESTGWVFSNIGRRED